MFHYAVVIGVVIAVATAHPSLCLDGDDILEPGCASAPCGGPCGAGLGGAGLGLVGLGGAGLAGAGLVGAGLAGAGLGLGGLGGGLGGAFVSAAGPSRSYAGPSQAVRFGDGAWSSSASISGGAGSVFIANSKPIIVEPSTTRFVVPASPVIVKPCIISKSAPISVNPHIFAQGSAPSVRLGAVSVRCLKETCASGPGGLAGAAFGDAGLGGWGLGGGLGGLGGGCGAPCGSPCGAPCGAPCGGACGAPACCAPACDPCH